MGTDIHFFMDKKVVDENGNVDWVGVTPKKYDGNRHYYLFGWLANVRNGFGFAGCDLGDAIKPILPDPFLRGLPDDIKARLAAQGEEDFLDGEWLGDHSYNWLTSTEILEAAKDLGAIKKRGVISAEEWIKWDKVTPLESYSGGCFGRGIYTLDQSQVTGRMAKGFAYAINLTEATSAANVGNNWVTRYVKEKVPADGIYRSSRIWNMIDGYRDIPEDKSNWVDKWVPKRRLKRRKSVLKHQRKLERYQKRVGQPMVRAEWDMPHEALYENFKYFIDEIRELHEEHGEFRMVMGFDS